MGLQIRLLGVRGSLPTPYYPEFLEQRIHHILDVFTKSRYAKSTDVKGFMETLPRHLRGGFGGNTTCVDVRSEKSYVIIDGGSGLRRLVPEMMAGPCSKGKGEVHIFLTHFHWDHTCGLPFFVPLFIKGNNIHFYGVEKTLEPMMRTLFQKPYFPVPYETLGASIHYHYLEPRKEFKLGDMLIAPYKLDHPDPCWGYRIESGGKVYSHCVDTEGVRISPLDLGPDLPMYQGVDLMLFDGQYTLKEASERINWGHSSATKGLELAIREGIKKIVFIHHDPWASDDHVSQIMREAQNYYENEMKTAAEREEHKVEWFVGREGMSFTL